MKCEICNSNLDWNPIYGYYHCFMCQSKYKLTAGELELISLGRLTV